MSGSVSFDRVAHEYDRTRVMDPEAAEKVTGLLHAELKGCGAILEVGVGTGRISLPLHERGLPMTGVDLSGAMLGKLIENAGGTRPFPLARGDATMLPFRDASFGAALASHVFHLIPNWHAAVQEMARVVRPDGVILSDQGTISDTPAHAIVKQICHVLGIVRRFPGLDLDGGDPPDSVQRALAPFGFVERKLPEVVSPEKKATPRDYLGHFASRTWSWTWDLSEEQMQRAVTEVEAWLPEKFGDPDRPIETGYPIRWSVFQRR